MACPIGTSCPLPDNDQSGHALAEAHSVVRVADHCFLILSHDQPAIACRMLQDDLVGGGAQAKVVGADEVEARLTVKEPAYDVAIEALVCEQPRTDQSRPRSVARFMSRSWMATRSTRDSFMRRYWSARARRPRRYSSMSAVCSR